MRQRLGIAQAILHNPNLLILDEPTNGLDPEGIKEMRELLITLAQKEKMAILISSHNLAELDSFCNKVCIIKNGEVIETSDIENIKKDKITHFQIFEVNDTTNITNILADILSEIEKNKEEINKNTEKNKEEINKNIEKVKEENNKITKTQNSKIENQIVIQTKTTFKINIEKEKVPTIVEKLIANQVKIYSIKEEEKTLEEAFFERTGGNVID